MDASFAGEWDKQRAKQASTDPNMARSRTGYIITYCGISITWGSKLQTKIALSLTKAEMIALSPATRENIFLLRLMANASEHGIDLNMSNAKLHCRVLEDNTGTIAIAKEPRVRPRTKHICIKMWHFLDFLKTGLMSIEWVLTENQLADILTKPLPAEAFHRPSQDHQRMDGQGDQARKTLFKQQEGV